MQIQVYGIDGLAKPGYLRAGIWREKGGLDGPPLFPLIDQMDC